MQNGKNLASVVKNWTKNQVWKYSYLSFIGSGKFTRAKMSGSVVLQTKIHAVLKNNEFKVDSSTISLKQSWRHDLFTKAVDLCFTACQRNVKLAIRAKPQNCGL